jgi:replication initiation and membrane attachment protein DnaB
MTEFNKFRWNDHPIRVALKGTASALATVMFNKANMDGTKVYVTQETLADVLTVSVRTVRRAQTELESFGLIRCVVKGSNLGTGKPSVYELTMPPETTGHLFAQTIGQPPDMSRDHRTSVT